MNKQRRKAINCCTKALEDVKNRIEEILSEEENFFDNMPENLQGSIRGEESQEAIDVLNEVKDGLEDCIESLNGIC